MKNLVAVLALSASLLLPACSRMGIDPSALTGNGYSAGDPRSVRGVEESQGIGNESPAAPSN